MTKPPSSNLPENDQESSFLWKQAWDYFSAHGAQRMTIFNFLYRIVVSHGDGILRNL